MSRRATGWLLLAWAVGAVVAVLAVAQATGVTEPLLLVVAGGGVLATSVLVVADERRRRRLLVQD